MSLKDRNKFPNGVQLREALLQCMRTLERNSPSLRKKKNLKGVISTQKQPSCKKR